MNYEKKYNEALERARKLYEQGTITESLCYVFPELTESEDERVRKELLSFFTERAKYTEDSTFNGLSSKEIISWLEKQGKQKETLCDKCKKTQSSHSCQDITALGRCALEKQGEQKLTKFEKAVKQVMEESIECGDTHNLKADAEMLLSLVHNSSWSEDDELHIRELESLVKQVWTTAEHENDKDTIHKMSDLSFFLKTLKPQPKQEWSEEDFNKIANALFGTYAVDVTIRLLNKIKSLRPQSTWKPSDEQIKALNSINVIGSISYPRQGQELINLYQDLKKLREE